MDINMGAKSLLLISRIMEKSSATASIIPQKPQKIEFVERESPAPLDRTLPEAKGMDSGYIMDYLTALMDDKTTHPHAVTIVKDGAIISETAFFPYRSDVWNISYSLCKSITALAIGLLIDDGKLTLDTKLSEIFEKPPKLSNPRVKALTVHQLLTMSTGVIFNEAGTVTERNWLKSYFESLTFFEAGSKFSYNSMNTYVLSAIVKHVAGMSLTKFLNERFFKHMGIVNFYWERCPRGVEKGGMGMYLLPEDMAKLGLLYLQKGCWNGQQLISEHWISEATRVQMEVPDSIGSYHYGYQVWIKKGGSTFCFNGMFGQNVLIFPERGLVIAIAAGDNDYFQTGAFFPISERFFGAEATLPEAKDDPAAGERLREFERRCAEPRELRHSRWFRPFDSEDNKSALSEVKGKIFDMEAAQGASLGVLPLMAQCIGNNFSSGLKRISFDVPDETLLVTIAENDETHQIPVGLDKAAYSTLWTHGEPYLIGTSGLFAVNEDDILVLKITIFFLEIPNTRTIKFYFNQDGTIDTKWSENPDQLYLLNWMRAIMNAAPDIVALNFVTKHIVKTYRARAIEKTFNRSASGSLAEQ